MFLAQGGFHFYTATLPLALSAGGLPDAAIGLVVGVSAVIQIPAAIVGGRLVDRFGGGQLLILGGLCYISGSVVLLLPWADPKVTLVPFVAARLLQGLGLAVTLPAALSLVPLLLPAARHPTGLSIVGAAQNLTLTLVPLISLQIFWAAGLAGVSAAAVVAVGASLLLFRTLRIPPRAAAAGRAASRRAIIFRRAWAVPLLIVVTYVIHWGVVTAYLPVRATAESADIGLYFAADGIAIFAIRLPSAWLAERISTRTLIVVGAVLTTIAIGMLLLPLSTPLLVVSGLLGGTAGGLVLSPVLFELSRRSDESDRGSAFALYSGALAGAISAGSMGGSPVVAVFGFPAALVGGIAMIGVAAALALLDPSLRGIVTAPAQDGATAAGGDAAQDVRAPAEDSAPVAHDRAPAEDRAPAARDRTDPVGR